MKDYTEADVERLIQVGHRLIVELVCSPCWEVTLGMMLLDGYQIGRGQLVPQEKSIPIIERLAEALMERAVEARESMKNHTGDQPPARA